jgi:nucleoside-diphosphate-sugar epimerase
LKVLLTGNNGYIGKLVENELRTSGHTVVGYDLSSGFDVLNQRDLISSSQGCETIIHLAAIETENSLDTIRTNLVGTLNVLNTCKDLSIKRLVFMSSVDSLGIFQGEDIPKYLPIDDQYPCHPKKVYSISKKLSEELCADFADKHMMDIISLRAPGVWSEETYGYIKNKRKENPEFEWSPYWEYGAFIDVRDLATAIRYSVEKDIHGFHNLLIASNDITTSGLTTMELVKKIHPTVLWKGGIEYELDLYRSLVNCSEARTILGWEPKYKWRDFS